MYAKPLLDSENKIIGAIEVNQDITEIKKIENTYKNGFRNWEAIFNQDNIAVIQLSGNHTVYDLNKSAERLLDTDRAKTIGNTIESLFDESTCSSLRKITATEVDNHLSAAYKISGQLQIDTKIGENCEMLAFVDKGQTKHSTILIIMDH